MKNMKIIVLVISLIILNSCELFELDNYQGPDGGIYGRFIDADTNKPVPMPVAGSTGVLIQISETDSASGQPINFYANQDGTFTNTKVFNGDYITAFEGPFVVIDEYPVPVTINGMTEIDIRVTPYARVSATATVNGENVTVSYEIELVADTVSLDRVYAYWNYQKLVDSKPNHYADRERGEGENGSITFDLANDENYLDNKDKIEANGNRVYFRVGAQVQTNLNETEVMNYSEVIEVVLP